MMHSLVALMRHPKTMINAIMVMDVSIDMVDYGTRNLDFNWARDVLNGRTHLPLVKRGTVDDDDNDDTNNNGGDGDGEGENGELRIVWARHSLVALMRHPKTMINAIMVMDVSIDMVDYGTRNLDFNWAHLLTNDDVIACLTSTHSIMKHGKMLIIKLLHPRETF
ncbi:hypothetical protein ACHAXA_001336 [Cyclostephanos tholiformis]|uniref:Uncharacterized protein n=1 Tax=Cyclostephanos tholiformis TaxID=382380 RepID=A0ABD3RGE0_9STRA